MKNLYYGFLHVAVAMTSILFVTSITGLNLPLVFLTVGIGTIIFHIITQNKLAVIMGVSGSYIAGMTYVAVNCGPEYVAGGVVISGVVYIIAAILLIVFPKVLNAFPKYILNMAVFLIALNLLPIGASLIKSSPIVAVITLAATFIVYMSKWNGYAMPVGLIVGTTAQAVLFGLKPAELMTKIVFTSPKINLLSLTMIGIVAIAVVFEALGDSTNCANAQGITLEERDMSRILRGNGLASLFSGALGGPPLTSYSENVGFIYMSGWTNPKAQIISAYIFIGMAFVPAIPKAFSYVPLTVFGAMLVFLFALVGANSIKNVKAKEEELPIVLLMLLTYFITPIVMNNFSPIAAAIMIGMIGNLIWRRRGLEKTHV